jgi:GGDEF domain-containing protein
MRDRKNRFVILCPETNLQNSEQLADRIAKAVQDKTGLQVMWSTVGFPDDALNFDDLLIAAQTRVSAPIPVNVKKGETSSAKQDLSKDVK